MGLSIFDTDGLSIFQPDIIQRKTVSVTAANIIAMYATPVLVLAGVSEKMIAVDNISFVMTRSSTAFTGGGTAKVQYGNTAHAGGYTIGYIHTGGNPMITGTEGVSYKSNQHTDVDNEDTGDVVNTGLYISNLTAAFATGTGTGVLTIMYHLI